MPTPPTSQEKMREAVELIARYGNGKLASEATGIPQNTLLNRARAARTQLDPAIKDSMAAVGTNMVPQLAWLKTKNEDGTGYSVLLKPEKDDDFLTQMAEAFQDIPSAPVVPEPMHTVSDLLTLYPLADIHLGMMAWGRETGEDYNTKIASDRMQSWVGQCVASSPASEIGVILGAGDAMHADDQNNMTPQSKHVLDVDTRHFKTLDVAIIAFAACVELALAKHKLVIVRILPGNHDRTSYLVLVFALAERYRDNPRVVVEKRPGEFWVHEFGVNMIACHHGDKAQPERIAMALADDHAEIWGRTRHRFLWTGHLHSYAGKDIAGIKWERLRAMTARDAYAASHAYASRAELQAITYSRTKGEVMRVRVAA